MKLHLPIGLRRALVAVLAALPVFTVAASITASTASAGLEDYVKTTTTGSLNETKGDGITIGEYSQLFGVTTVFNEISNATIQSTGTSYSYKEWFQTKWTDPKVLVQGMLNTVDHSTLYSKNSSVTLNGVEEGWGVDAIMKVSYVKDLVKSKLAEYGFTNVSDDGLKILLNQSANIVQDGSKLQAGTNVTLDAKVNMVSSSALNAGQTVEVKGGINAMLGADIDGKNVKFTGTAVNLGEIATLYPMAKGKLTRGEDDIMGIPVGTVDKLVEALKPSLGGVEVSANMLMGGTVDATEKVTLSATGNVIAGGTEIHATDIVLEGVDTALPLKDLYTAIKNKEGLMDSLTGILPGGIDDLLPLVEPMLGTDAMTKLQNNFSVNLVHGGGADLIATGDVTMTALGNVVSKNALVQGKDVTMTGLANIVALKTPTDVGATVRGTNCVTMDGMLNVVYDGKVIGGDISLGMSDLEEDENGQYKSGNRYANTLSLGDVASIVPDGLFGPLSKQGIAEALETYMPGYLNMNLVMGQHALLDGNSVSLGGEMNMISDRANVHGTNRVSISGFGNIVTDGATITSGNGSISTSDKGSISMSGTLNFVSHLTLNDIKNAMDGGKLPAVGRDTTTLTANGDIELWGTANVVHGSAEITSTAGDVLMSSKGSPILGLDSLTIDECVALAEKLGITPETLTNMGSATLGTLLERLSSDYYNNVPVPSDLLKSNVNIVTHGAKVSAENGKVTLRGTANAVMSGAEVSGMNVLMEGVNINPHLGAMTGVVLDSGLLNSLLGDRTLPAGTLETLNSVTLSANVVTGGGKVTATEDVEIKGGLNLVTDLTLSDLLSMVDKNGATQPGGGATAMVSADNNVTMSGLANVVMGDKAQVTGKNVTLKGSGEANIDWSPMLGDDMAQLAQGVDPNVNVVANNAQVTAENKLWMDGSANVVMGGADLKGDTIYLSSGGANVVVDTTLQNVADALMGDKDAIAEGGKNTTTLTAEKNLALNGVANAVNGKVELKAETGNVDITGAGNMLGGNAQVTASKDVTMTGKQSDTVLAVVELLPENYKQLAKDLGVEAFGSANVVMGGADVNAGNDVSISGGLNVVADATISDMLTLVDRDDTTWPGAGAETTVTAGNNIAINGMANVVMGNGAKLDADNNVVLEGTANIVSADAAVTAGNDIVLNGVADSGALYGIADSALEHGVMQKIADTFVPNGDALLGVLNTYNTANVVMDGASLKAGRDVKFSGAANVLDSATVTAGRDIVFGKDSVTSIKNTTLTAGNGYYIENGAVVTADSFTTSGVQDNLRQLNVVTLDNKGELTVGTADFSNTHVVNAGQMTVTDKLTLDNTALTFHMTDSLADGMISGNEAAIVLSSLDIVTLNSISSVTFVVTLEDLADGNYNFSLDLFTLAAADSKALTVATAGYESATDWLSALDGKVQISLMDAAGSSVSYKLNEMSVQVGSAYTVTGNLNIPEPTTATLSLLALVGLAARRRRK